MKKRLPIVIALLIVVSAGLYFYKRNTNQTNQNVLHFSGNIEVIESQLSFRIPGRLDERDVEEGDQVKKHQILARLDRNDQLIGIAQAEANLAYAESVLAELEAGSRRQDIDRAQARVMQAHHNLTELQAGSRSQEIESGKAALNSAVAAEQSAIIQLQQRKIDFDRYNKLYEAKSISKNIYETYKNLYDTADNKLREAKAKTLMTKQQLELLEAGPRIEQINKAKAQLKQAQAEYALVKAGPRKESIDQARAKARLAKEAVNFARQQLEYTKLIAPTNGVVLSVSAEPGEYLNPASPVLTVGQVDKPWLRAYINEKDLGRIKLDQQVTVSTDSYPSKTYSGRVSYISSRAEFTPKLVQTFEERVKLMYRIKVTLKNHHNELKPGMPADGRIDFSKE